MSDTFGPDDLMPWQEMTKRVKALERDRDILSTAVAELQRVISEFIRMQAQKVPELEEKLKYGEIQYPHGPVFHEVYTRLSKAECRAIELEEKVESLTRTLNMWQDIMGIEVVITAQTHEGVCEKCDRAGQLNTENICEGCFWEEAQRV